MNQTLSTDIRGQIQESLVSIAKRRFVDTARDFFAVLGYKSDRRIDITPNTAGGFVSQFGQLNAEKALTAEWLSVDFLFQLTDEEVGNRLAFSTDTVDESAIESYIFLAIHLTGTQYTRIDPREEGESVRLVLRESSRQFDRVERCRISQPWSIRKMEASAR